MADAHHDEHDGLARLRLLNRPSRVRRPGGRAGGRVTVPGPVTITACPGRHWLNNRRRAMHHWHGMACRCRRARPYGPARPLVRAARRTCLSSPQARRKSSRLLPAATVPRPACGPRPLAAATRNAHPAGRSQLRQRSSRHMPPAPPAPAPTLADGAAPGPSGPLLVRAGASPAAIPPIRPHAAPTPVVCLRCWWPLRPGARREAGAEGVAGRQPVPVRAAAPAPANARDMRRRGGRVARYRWCAPLDQKGRGEGRGWVEGRAPAQAVRCKRASTHAHVRGWGCRVGGEGGGSSSH